MAVFYRLSKVTDGSITRILVLQKGLGGEKICTNFNNPLNTLLVGSAQIFKPYSISIRVGKTWVFWISCDVFLGFRIQKRWDKF